MKITLPCLGLFHAYGKWVDVCKLDKLTMSTDALVATGIMQRRYCEKCNKVQTRVSMTPTA